MYVLKNGAFHLLEGGLPNKFKAIQQTGCCVLGFTARPGSEFQRKDNHPMTFGINFNNVLEDTLRSVNGGRLIGHKEGLYYTHGDMKGPYLKL